MSNHSHDEFITDIFSVEPKEKNYMKIRLDPPKGNQNISIYEFEQILQIFVDGLHYKFSEGNKPVNLDELNLEDIDIMEKYMHSLGYQFYIDKFIQTTYVKKEPDYFITKDKYTNKDKIELGDIYFEIATFHDQVKENIRHIYRIRFESLHADDGVRNRRLHRRVRQRDPHPGEYGSQVE